MQTCSAFNGALVIVLGMTVQAVAFDIKSLDANTPPSEALRFGITSYRIGNMYAQGDGVERNDYTAFKLFSDVAAHASDDGQSRRDQPTPFVTSAWAKLGAFLRRGIPNSDVQADPNRAREYFWRAAYFGDADAQLNLAAMFYNGEGGDRDLIQAAKWANLAADKGNPPARDLLIEIALELTQGHLDQADKPGNLRQAALWAKLAADYGSVDGQALYGHILFVGDGTARDPIQGLMYLTIALSRSGPGEDWIVGMHAEALSASSQADWQAAKTLADEWLAKNQAKLASGK
jgi:TPR repeat protein